MCVSLCIYASFTYISMYSYCLFFLLFILQDIVNCNVIISFCKKIFVTWFLHTILNMAD